MEVDLLYKKFKNAEKAENIEEITDCLLEAMELCESSKDNIPVKLQEILYYAETLLYGVMKAIDEKNAERAQLLAYSVFKYSAPIPQGLFIFFYLLGRTNYISKNYVRAAKFFYLQDNFRTEEWKDFDELSYFYRANSLAMQERFEEAQMLYEKILTIHADFPEVQNNLELVKQDTNENLILEVSSLWNFCDWQDVPIFINSRDRVGVLRKLINWLLKAGYKNLIILDNNSTYPKLLEYYSKLEEDERVKVVMLKKNLGYKALWLSNILEDMKISTPYVYTDPDVLPIDECPKDFMKRLIEVLDSNHEIRKVGLSLLWEDITIDDKEKHRRREFDFFKRGNIGDNVSYANVDTTFALYSNLRIYSLRFSLRTYGDFRLRHLPWYFNYKKLPEDEKYYLEHADRNSVTTVQDKIINKD